MKKTYMTPALAMTVIEQSTPLLITSLSVNNDAQDNISGDVKEAGEWEDIWE